MGWSKSVLSEMVAEIAWEETGDSGLGDMIVTFAKNGRRCAYEGVPEDVADACARAGSVGQFMNTEIKPYYGFRYV